MSTLRIMSEKVMATWINASACLSPFPCENNLRCRIRKHKISKKAKISTPAFPVYASKVMHLNNNSQLTKKSVVSLEKDYKMPLYPSKIPRLFRFHVCYSENTFNAYISIFSI